MLSYLLGVNYTWKLGTGAIKQQTILNLNECGLRFYDATLIYITLI